MTDFATARRHMVDGQVRTADVTDLRIISAMMDIPREHSCRRRPWGSPISTSICRLGMASRRLLKPMVFAKLIHAAVIASSDRVLDVGCATGYGAAVLARLAGQVIALEQDAGLAQAAPRGSPPSPM